MNNLHRALLILLVGVGLFNTANWEIPPRSAQAQDQPLLFFTPARGVLNDATPTQDWFLDGYTGQVISLLAITIDGNLDPVLQVLDPDGQIIGENDDLDSLVHDAGLEAFTLPITGRYTIRVSRYAATDAGTYELRATPGFAYVARIDTFDQGSLSWVTPQGQPVALAQGKLQMRTETPGETLIAIPPDAKLHQDMYFQASARLLGTSTYAEMGLVFQAQNLSGQLRSYQFKVNTNGQWSILHQDESGVFALRTWTAHTVLDTSAWTLGVIAREGHFSFYANAVLLGTMIDDRLSEPGSIGVLLTTPEDQTEAAMVLFDDMVVTTRLGTTYAGPPLALTTWNNNDPSEIMQELVESGLINPAPEHALFLPEATHEMTEQNTYFQLIGTDQAVYDNFVYSAWVTIDTVGENLGCGLVYRWQDERNLDMLYIDTVGGFGLVQARAGQLMTNVYDISDMVQRKHNKLLVIVQPEQSILYINGALITQEPVLPGEGRVGVTLLNYEPARTACLWSDIWVWELAQE